MLVLILGGIYHLLGHVINSHSFYVPRIHKPAS